MSDTLVARVAERLDIQPAQTDRVLQTLAQLIKKQSARDGRVRVPGLGVFEQAGETLTFEPDKALAEAVNARYAGLEPVPLPADEAPIVEEPAEDEAAPPAPVLPDAHDEAEIEEPAPEAVEPEAVEPEAVEPEAIEEETPAPEAETDDADYDDPDLSEAAAYAALASDTDEEPAELPPALAHPDAVEAQAEDTLEPPSEWAPPVIPPSIEDDQVEDHPVEDHPVEDDLMEDHPTEEPPTAEEAPDEAGTPAFVALPPDAVVETPPPAERADDLPPDPPKAPPRPRMAPPEPEEKRAAWPWLLGLLVLIVAAIGAFFYLRPTDEPTLATTPTTQAPPGDELPVTNDDPDATPDDPADGLPVTGEATPAETAPEDPPAEATPPEDDPPAGPLRIDRAQGGYALIVGSNVSRADAEQAAERFRRRLDGRGLPVDVLQGESNGVTRYRVAVGQVATIEAAQALLRDLGDAVPEGTWINRILPDS